MNGEAGELPKRELRAERGGQMYVSHPHKGPQPRRNPLRHNITGLPCVCPFTEATPTAIPKASYERSTCRSETGKHNPRGDYIGKSNALATYTAIWDLVIFRFGR